MKFSIYYSDDVVHGMDDPFAIERRGNVQVIVQPDGEHNWVTVPANDFYMWDDRGGGFKWFSGDVFGLKDYLMKPGPKCVLFGEHIDTALYRRILNQAIEDLGEKTGYSPRERKPHG